MHLIVRLQAIVDFEKEQVGRKSLKAISDLVTLDSGRQAVQVTEWIDPGQFYAPKEVLDNFGLTAGRGRDS